GTLRINAPMTFGVHHLSPLLPEFRARYPSLGLDLMLNDRFVDLLEEGVDVAVRMAELPDSSLIARRLAPGRPWRAT
ncbi:LysR substrate-binding domain-containing protein, partial [Acinetobacter johnsonii]|uniref:LysR substrate-binding domain-containing protein n=1 Tax=Acinetobacter johnsonii TaxID=40214 RepID=UPI001F18F974